MALTAQNVIDAVSTDVRKVLDATTNASIILGWVDRIHKDCLHSSVFGNLNQSYTTFNTVPGTNTYSLSPTDIRRILLVYDGVNDRLLLPADASSAPYPLGEQQAPSTALPPEGQVSNIGKFGLDVRTMANWPEYYLFVGQQTLIILPSPSGSSYAGSMLVVYEKQVSTVASTGTTLTIPEDGLDMLVAGVNSLAFTYLDAPERAAFWQQTYQMLKKGEVL